MHSATFITQRIKLMAVTNEIARVSFHDGGVYDLRVLSDMHAEEGGDVVAEIVGRIRARRADFPAVGDVVNVRLAEIAEIK
jgi:hypothetical protein